MLIEIDELDLQLLVITASAYTVDGIPHEMVEKLFPEADLNTWTENVQQMAKNLDASAKYNTEGPDLLKNIIQTLMGLSQKALGKE